MTDEERAARVAVLRKHAAENPGVNPDSELLLSELGRVMAELEEIHFLLAEGAQCSFCGTRMLREEAAEHMLACEKHPLAAALAQVAQVKTLRRFVEHRDSCNAWDTPYTSDIAGGCTCGLTDALVATAPKTSAGPQLPTQPASSEPCASGEPAQLSTEPKP